MNTLPSSYELRIQRWTPKTIPVERLAVYLSLLAKLLGFPEHVHFDRIRSGSTRPMVTIEQGYRSQVQQRLQLCGSPEAPADLLRARNDIDAALRADDTHGKLMAQIAERRGAEIIDFPGIKHVALRDRSVNEHTAIDGQVVGVVGKDETISVKLLVIDGSVFSCETRNKDLARSLAAMLWQGRVRLSGRGKWVRRDAQWKLEELKLESFERLQATTLKQDVDRLRAIAQNPWSEFADPLEEALAIRRGA
jgi:hypothetical protein